MRAFMRTASAGLLAITVLAGCQSMTGKTAGQNVTDAGITAAVKSKLADEKVSSVTRVDVDTSLGVVTLTGVVENDADKQRLVAAARQVEGVRRVEDRMTVQAPPATAGAPASRSAGQVIDDATITAAVKTKLVGESMAALTKVNVDTLNGTVTLTGTVASDAMRARAGELAGQVSGVRQVVNNLRVSG